MKKVELRELEVLEVSSTTVEVRASYVIPADRGRGRQFGAQVFTCRLRKDGGLVRIRIQGRDGPFGHYDASQGKWFPTDVVRQGIFSDVIEAVIAAARKELEK